MPVPVLSADAVGSPTRRVRPIILEQPTTEPPPQIAAGPPTNGAAAEGAPARGATQDAPGRGATDRAPARGSAVKFCHTLNNTVIASPRILIPLLELNQTADGSVTVPKALRGYMNGLERIAPP